MKAPVGLVGVALFLALPRASEPTVWHVPSQCPTIQSGIDSAAVGDTVLVACGTYYEHDIQLRSGVLLRSETGKVDCVTIDAERRGRVFSCEDVEPAAAIQGITLVRGYGDYGGGLYCARSSLVLSDCVFEDNLGGGGGIYCAFSSFAAEACTLANNRSGGPGGGAYFEGSSVRLEECAILGNTGFFYGGGIYCAYTTIEVVGCQFCLNSALVGDIFDGVGGGMFCGSGVITDCVFSANTACFVGGGLFCFCARVTGCVFYDNGSSCGGAAACREGSQFENCTFYGNDALGAIYYGDWCMKGSEEMSSNALLWKELWREGSQPADSGPSFTNCIIAFNRGREAVSCTPWEDWPPPTFTCCDIYGNDGGDWIGCIEDHYGINGNFSADPLFCDLDNRDFHLYDISPCAPAEISTCGLIGALGIGCESSPEPRVWHVRPDGSGDLPTIQDAVNRAASGDTIVLSNGVFRGSRNRDISFYGKAVVVRSEGGRPDSCIIDCEGSPGEEHGGFRFDHREASSSVLDGLTVRRGYARRGGGIYCQHASPTIRNCVFVDNAAWENGGVLYCVDSSSPSVSQSTFSGNSTDGRGAGVFVDGSSAASLTNCIMAFSTQGEAVYCTGSGLVTLECCDVYGNSGGDWVGCIEGHCGIDGNISADPLFCDQETGDVRVCWASPCLPENNACGVLIGALSLGDCDCPVGLTFRVPYDYPTISEALAVVSCGDTVLVSPGTYEENVVLPWGVTLLSTHGCDSTAIDGRGGETTVKVSYEGAKPGDGDIPAKLGGFTITGAIRTGIVVVGCDPVITGCIVTGNSGLDGGGLSCHAASPIVTYCTIYGNQASTRGGGFYAEDSSPAVENCTLSGNAAPEGGGICSWSSRGTVGKTVLAFNDGDAVRCYGEAEPTLTCCDLFANEGGDWIGCIADQYGVNGNFSADPLFCNPDSGGFHLDVNSPCAPASAGACGLIGALGTACEDLPPDLALGVFQDSDLTQYLDIHVVSSEQLDSASVILRVASDTIAVRCLDDIEHIWMGDYELTGSGDSISIQACASDIRGNDTCVAMSFSASLVKAASGGVAKSVDGRMRVILAPHALDNDAYVLILPGVAEYLRSESGLGVLADAMPLWTADQLETPDSYYVSPEGILEGSSALLEYSYSGTSLEQEPPDRLCLERVGQQSLISLVDPNTRTITATIPEFGTFRAVLSSVGSGTVRDPRFLQVDQNFPNPFGRNTTIRFEVRDRQRVSIDVFDVRGRFVGRILDARMEPGSHGIGWDGRAEGGFDLQPGVYFYRVRGEVEESIGKTVLVR